MCCCTDSDSRTSTDETEPTGSGQSDLQGLRPGEDDVVPFGAGAWHAPLLGQQTASRPERAREDVLPTADASNLG